MKIEVENEKFCLNWCLDCYIVSFYMNYAKGLLINISRGK